MTQDVYMGRRAVDQAAAAVLEGISPPGDDGGDQPPAVWAPWDSNPQPTEFKSRLSVVQHDWSLMPCD
jgi:hypothetical protein